MTVFGIACRWAAWLLFFCVTSAAAIAATSARIVEPTEAWRLRSDATDLPGIDAAWEPVRLPDNRRPALIAGREPAAWYRVEFHLRRSTQQPGAYGAYLPYLRDGGQIYLNGSPVERIAENSDTLRVKWERPHLVPLPDNLLHEGRNVLVVRTQPVLDVGFPKLAFGPTAELLPLQERRQFWVLTMPQITIGGCIIVAALTLLVWSRRREEQLYGLFGLSVLFWGLRTVNLVIETLPIEHWWTWRLVYHASTGGFICLLALFVLRFANVVQHPAVWRVLLAYWLICPISMTLFGIAADTWLHKVWTAGFVPMGLTAVLVTIYAAWKQRGFRSYAMLAGMLFAVVSGIHDYLLLVGWLAAIAPEWDGHHVFLLHHGANIMLAVMGGILTQRFIHVLTALEDLNQSLETRIAEREAELDEQYQRTHALERERATVEERRRIMQDMHDGLGSELFQSLSRAERGNLAAQEMADSLRSCIDEMRLALEALGSADDSFFDAVADFRFRWERQFAATGIHSTWQIEFDHDALKLPPRTTLQYLRILQEALTNVLKHARAREVRVRISGQAGRPHIEVEDDGAGFAGTAVGPGHGLGNMRRRADLLGARLEIESVPGRTRIALDTALPESAAET